MPSDSTNTTDIEIAITDVGKAIEAAIDRLTVAVNNLAVVTGGFELFKSSDLHGAINAISSASRYE